MKTIYIKKVNPDLAYPVDSKKRIVIDNLALEDIQKPSNFSGRIYVAGRCSSSLDLAWTLMDEGDIRIWDSVLCLEQWAGRGQLRRTWVSPSGNIYAAWHWPELPAKWKRLTSILAGYILALSFAEIGAEIKIKWPNDLLFQGKKVGGVLVEEKKDKVLVGVGINVISSPPRASLRDDTAVEAGDLRSILKEVGKIGSWEDMKQESWELNPIILWSKLVYKAYNWYMHILRHCSLEQFAASVTKLLAYLGQEVAVAWGQDIIYGQVVGLDVDGSLLLKDSHELIRINSGSLIGTSPEDSACS
ncbi:biotin--[acetyl-CoA-carboxylase] ligase [Desulfovulcanus sp.]